MCEHGDIIPMKVTIPARLSYTGQERTAIKPIDRCIAPAIQWLNANGYITGSSCCGHGKIPGEIIIECITEANDD